ncbi:uncharacterized protein LOC122668675 [Telopea speciosissima]|uniref:uncharacterized protein LOC122668675 n=1 Tax=Telopea speciosissima TaxID=54955 RepID=UPI001CC8033A|nr:uncharacterized protein LOC122668675 [Telopea speciosissima]
MKILSWNCRGLGRTPTVHSLVRLSREEKPMIIFLIETKAGREKIERLRKKLRMHGCFSVDSIGASGGLALFWNHSITVDILCSDSNIIDSKVTQQDGSTFFMTSVYGAPVRTRRQDVWNRLIQIGGGWHIDWLCYGDFNSFLSWHEKQGGNRIGQRDIDNFKDLVNTCALVVIGTHGPCYTWNNKRKGNSNIRIKLDRAMANDAWSSSYLDVAVFVKPVAITKLQEGPPRDDYQKQEDCLISFLNEELDREEELWRQKSRVDWLQQGDRNTKFFHLTTIQHRSQNRILKLRAPDGGWIHDEGEIYDLMIGYYQEIFKSEGLEPLALNQVLTSIQPGVNDDMNSLLCAMPTIDEMCMALFAMALLKAPSPVGLPPVFFQKY